MKTEINTSETEHPEICVKAWTLNRDLADRNQTSISCQSSTRRAGRGLLLIHITIATNGQKRKGELKSVRRARWGFCSQRGAASRLVNISPREAAPNVLRAARRSSADMKTTRTINGHLHYRFICQLLVMLQECQIHLVQSQDSESISLDSRFSRKCQVKFFHWKIFRKAEAWLDVNVIAAHSKEKVNICLRYWRVQATHIQYCIFGRISFGVKS